MPAVRAPDPSNERQRLATLRGYAILDTEPEAGFDDLTALASFICGVPISTMTLIDEDRQWFKSKVGTDDTEGPRDWSFCAYAVASGETFVVPDALEDERFATNPYVTGEPRIRFYAGVPLTTEDGSTLGTLCVIDREPRELTREQAHALQALANQVLAQLELRRQNHQLRELDRVKDEFVAAVSHELRTPLTSIRGYVETLLDGEPGDLSADQQRFLEIVDRNASRLLKLVGDLLFIAQVTAGRLELEVGAVTLDELVAESVEQVRPAAATKEVEVSASAEPVVIPGDPQRIGQMLDNLVSNAVKFTPEHGRVTVEAVRDNGAVRIRVADSGIGIPAHDLPRLFSRFTRASNATQIPGTGLGLAISRTIAEAHGGSIDVESAEGKGTTFTVRLPL